MAPIYREYAEELGIDPVKYMLEVVADKSLEPRMRLDAAKASAPYLASKLRHTEVEVSAPFNGDPATIPTSALIQRILEGRSHEELAEMLLGERGT